MKARFGKRLLSSIIDLSLVIAVVYLLYLFPFKMILGNSVVKDFNKSYKKPYETIEEKYQGKYGLFNSTPGIFTNLSTNGTNGYISEDYLAEYYGVYEYNKAWYTNTFNTYFDELNEPYNSELKLEDRVMTKTQMLFISAYYAHSLMKDYTEISNQNNVQARYDSGEIDRDTYDTLLAQEKDKVDDEFIDIEVVFYRIYLHYMSLNPSVKVENDAVYQRALSDIRGYTKKAIDLDSLKIENHPLTSDEVNKIKDYLFNYCDHIEPLLNPDNATLDTSGSHDQEKLYYVFSQKTYSIVQTEYTIKENIEFMPYSTYISMFNDRILLYAIVGFVAVLSIYTIAMKGRTVGRRVSQIRLEGTSVNPLTIFLHDVLFKYLYFLVLAFFFQLIAIVFIMIIILVIDFCMITFNKSRKTIRDYLSGLSVVHAGYGY